ncbi:hypothetical protein RG963_09780 [Methanosarcina sp. Z-7115]|uniref:DUF7343 domain-containing protein n=1 Tax=Methanosarcina baikalica TaxID=3073890 RepID=A0ABU2D254_9EURY|nr:hypothetical protein [Methanosarcina sp. Z-7115]MDR7666058.1 hypothetical protein [Methanosarcina sp. Z-7115]
MKINLRFYIICVAAILALVVPAIANSNNTATIHGEVYGWDTFEPLENAVVDVNSTPSQSMVAKYGLYSFKLAPGDYSITARYYQNSTLIYSAEEIVQIKGEGDYVRDLLLLPVYSEELMDGSEVNGSSSNLNESAENSSSNKVNPLTETAIDEVNNSNNLNLTGENGADSSTVSYMLIALTFFILITGGYQLSRKHKKIEKTPPKEKTEHITGNSSKLVNTHELSVKVPDKSIEPEIRSDFQANTEETVYVKGPETEPEPKLIITSPGAEPELKIILMETGAEPEPKISERKIPAESKEEYPVLETELAESGPEEEEEENEIISLEEPEDSPEIGTPAPKKKLPLPADLQVVMDIIRGQGGRITQKDLRSKLKYSEGKVSLMLADLERRELIEKFKRGRGNVVILRDEER